MRFFTILALIVMSSGVAHAAQPAFTDTDFARLAKKSSTSLIYTWSPHMNLSVDGLSDILVKKHPHREVVILLDPNANRDMAEKLAKQHRWPASVLRTFESRKLREVGAGIHYPSYIVVSKRKPAGQILPGYKTDEQIESFIRGWKQ